MPGLGSQVDVDGVTENDHYRSSRLDLVWEDLGINGVGWGWREHLKPKCANSVLLYAFETSVIEGQNQGNGRGVMGSGWFEKYLGS